MKKLRLRKVENTSKVMGQICVVTEQTHKSINSKAIISFSVIKI